MLPCSLELFLKRDKAAQVIENYSSNGIMVYLRSELDTLSSQFIFEENFSDSGNSRLDTALSQEKKFTYLLQVCGQDS